MKLKKVPKVSLKLTLTRPVQDLIPWLLGQELMFGTPAQNAFDSLKLENAEEILLLLQKTEYIKGRLNEWHLTPKVYAMVHKHLSTVSKTLTFESTEKRIVSVLELSRMFESAVAPYNKKKPPSLFVLFRKLSQRYEPAFIAGAIPKFITAQKLSQTPRFTTRDFEKFLVSLKKAFFA